MADALELAMCVRDVLRDLDAELSFAPQFDLADLNELKVVVVPTDFGLGMATRGSAEEEFGVEVGFLKKATEDELPDLVRFVADVAGRFPGEHFCDAACVEAKFNPLYSPDHLRERRQFTSVLALTFRRHADVCPR